jgi:membrane-bound serine protease (ClpP class)
MLIVVALVLFFLLPSPWDVVALVVGVALGTVELLAWRRTVRKLPKATGAEALIGQEATVVEPCHPVGRVAVHGEWWKARCEEGADPEDVVRVVGRRKLTLTVERT